MSQDRDLRIAAINRHRIKFFGDSSLKLYEITPADGETELVELTDDFKGHRVFDTTSQVANRDSGWWQFQIVAAEDWRTSQISFLKAVTLTVGDQKWKITKVEKPVGVLQVWKIRGQMQ